MIRRALFAAWLAGALPGHAATIAVLVKDASGAPLEDAIAWAVPKAPVASRPKAAAVEQIGKTFVPLVTVVQAGAPITFPNRDDTRHHVYSFSPAKVFEIKLYAGTPSAPIVFDKPGDVVLGCNIHDNMIGYIYVVDSPFFGKAAADGAVRLEGLPPGDYTLRAWHYAQAAAAAPQALTVHGDEAIDATFTFTTRPKVPRGR